ncbi:hypothetical protein LIER_40088 [Lithospermum erythrorhizon]|uniref:DUF7032 domain-containing protein n=1 Tax=Lithospermum erythrorhizon TaxID=34254 RepID=A0AAV3QSK7_LITER
MFEENCSLLVVQESLEEDKPSTQKAIEAISSLISVSYSIKVFSAKWQSIRNKLDELLSSLTAIENCDTNNNPEVFSSIQAISETIKDCHDQAKKCLNQSYSGKLIMQSDLDIVSRKLDNHKRNLLDIYNLGLLTQSYAIVVSKPSLHIASRDDMKFYVLDLFSRIKIGSADMKKQALIAFNEAIQEDDRYVKIAAEIDNFFIFLVQFLDIQESEIQENVAKVVSMIAGFESCKRLLIGAGIIAPLVRGLESESELTKEFATNCLQKLTENADNAWSVSAHGGVTSLLKICNNGENRGGLVGSACGVLKNIVIVQEIKRFIIDENAIPLFIKLVRSKDEVIQISSIDFLQAIARGDDSIRKLIIKEGGVRALIRVLDPKSSSSTKGREMALRVIMTSCISSENSLHILMSYGFLDHILYFFRFGEFSIQEVALKAAFWLSGTSEEAKKAMGDAGFIPELVKFLGSKSFEIGEMAAETLSNMMIIPRNRKRFVHNEQNVGLLLQMLDPEETNSGNKKLLLSILMTLTSCNSARKKIVNSGYLKHIEKLAEDEVSDAKKIVRRLSGNKFRNMLNGLWHS